MAKVATALTTRRLVLQPISSAHVHGLYDAIIASRAELLPWMPWARDPTVETSRLYANEADAARKEDHEYHFAVVEPATKMVLGVVGVNRVDNTTCLELHYWIRSDRAGHGLATEACGAIITWAVNALGTARFTLWAGQDNAASRRVAEKLGFTDVGPMSWKPDGGQGTFAAEAYELLVTTAMPRIR